MANKMVSLLVAGIVLMSAVTSLPARAQDAAKHLLKLGVAGPFELAATGPSAQIRIPVLPDTGLTEGDTLGEPVIYDVALNNRHNKPFRDALKLQFDKDERGSPTALLADVNLDLLAEAGTYTVVVSLTATPKQPAKSPSPPAERKQDMLTFQLVVPTAALAAVPVIKLTHEDFPLDGVSLTTQMVLRETTRRSRVTPVVVDDSGAASPMTVVVAPQEGSKKGGPLDPMVIPAGGRFAVPLAVSGDPGVGTYSGKLLVSAPQLSNPVEVAYEVTLRHPSYMIILILIPGLVIGQLLRVHLKGRIQDNAARMELLQQRRQLADEKSRYPDDAYLNALKEIDRDLERVSKRSATDIKTALQTANEKLTKAQQALEERRKDATSRINSLKPVLDRGWVLPVRLHQAVLAARGAVEQAQGDVRTNPGRAIATLEAADSKLRTEVYQGAQDWKLALARLTHIQSKDVKLPTAMKDDLAPLITQLQEGVAVIAEGNSKMELKDVLEAIDPSTKQASRFRDALRLRVIPLARSVLGVLAANKTSGGSLDKLAQETRRCDERWKDNADPLAVIGNLTEDLQLLTDSMEQTIQESSVNETARKAAAALAEQGDYLGAARRTLQKEPFLGSATPESSLTDSLVSGPGGQAQLQAAPPPPATGTAFQPAPSPRLSLEQLEVRTGWQLAADRLLQQVLIGLILVLAGYSLFSKSFVGTLADYMTLFFWAFATDVTMEAIDKVSSSVKKPTS